MHIIMFSLQICVKDNYPCNNFVRYIVSVFRLVKYFALELIYNLYDALAHNYKVYTKQPRKT